MSDLVPSSVDPAEVARFSALAAEWWDPRGKFAPLHALNPVRLGFIREQALARFGRDAASRRPPYDFLDEPLHRQIVEAHARGEACLVKLQVVVDGRPTVWASQYDEDTLEPCMARSFELPALISAESVGVLEYLMKIEKPGESVRRAITSGVQWFERSQIVGLRIERVAAAPSARNRRAYRRHSHSMDHPSPS